jgi:hypothetical protein
MTTTDIPFSTVISIGNISEIAPGINEIEALRRLRPRELNAMSDIELMQVIDRIRKLNDDAEPYDLLLSHIQVFCQVIYQQRQIHHLLSKA